MAVGPPSDLQCLPIQSQGECEGQLQGEPHQLINLTPMLLILCMQEMYIDVLCSLY